MDVHLEFAGLEPLYLWVPILSHLIVAFTYPTRWDAWEIEHAAAMLETMHRALPYERCASASAPASAPASTTVVAGPLDPSDDSNSTTTSMATAHPPTQMQTQTTQSNPIVSVIVHCPLDPLDPLDLQRLLQTLRQELERGCGTALDARDVAQARRWLVAMRDAVTGKLAELSKLTEFELAFAAHVASAKSGGTRSKWRGWWSWRWRWRWGKRAVDPKSERRRT